MLLAAVAAVLANGWGVLAAGDPSFYVKGATWHGSMLASREALAQIERQGGKNAIAKTARQDGVDLSRSGDSQEDLK